MKQLYWEPIIAWKLMGPKGSVRPHMTPKEGLWNIKIEKEKILKNR